MREDRFFVDFKISRGKVEILNKEIFHQLKNVLKKKTGERIILFNGEQESVAEIKNYLKGRVGVEVLDIRENKREPKIFVSLYCSILKKKNFELVVQKTTEIGVKKIVPLICKNTVKQGLNLERLKKIAKEASEQSGRLILPEISKPLKFKEAVKKVENFDSKIIFDISGKDCLKNNLKDNKKFAVFIGPEGGWDKEEVELTKRENFEILNLGKLNLRAETAAIVATFFDNQFAKLIIPFSTLDKRLLIS